MTWKLHKLRRVTAIARPCRNIYLCFQVYLFLQSIIILSFNYFSYFCTSLDAPIAESIQQLFLDDLLTSYQQMETSYTKHLYQFYKGFEFRSLWDVEDRLTNFQRTASEAAHGNGQLQGVVQLTNAVQEIDRIQLQGQQCFTRNPYTTDTVKWSFDNVTHAAVCMHASFAYVCMHACVHACIFAFMQARVRVCLCNFVFLYLDRFAKCTALSNVTCCKGVYANHSGNGDEHVAKQNVSLIVEILYSLVHYCKRTT